MAEYLLFEPQTTGGGSFSEALKTAGKCTRRLMLNFAALLRVTKLLRFLKIK